MSNTQGLASTGGLTSARDLFRREQEAALEGLSAALSQEEAPLEADAFVLALRVIGDGLRIGIPLPAQVRLWLRNARHEALAEAVERQANLVESTEGLAAVEPGHLARTRIITWLDESDSIAIAIRRALFAEEPSLALDRTLDDLARATKRVRSWVVANVRSAEACAALQGRTEMTSTWLDELATDGAGEPATEVDLLARLSAGIGSQEPSDEILDAYVRQGTFARYIDAVARQNTEFENTLRGVIEAHVEAGNPVSIPAHLRLRQRVRVALALKKAAATSERSAAPVFHDLGHLGAIDAEAQLTEEGAELVLDVYPEKTGDIARVGLGDATSAAEVGGKLSVRVPRRPGVLHLTVESRSGELLEVDLEVEA